MIQRRVSLGRLEQCLFHENDKDRLYERTLSRGAHALGSEWALPANRTVGTRFPHLERTSRPSAVKCRDHSGGGWKRRTLASTSLGRNTARVCENSRREDLILVIVRRPASGPKRTLMERSSAQRRLCRVPEGRNRGGRVTTQRRFFSLPSEGRIRHCSIHDPEPDSAAVWRQHFSEIMP